MAQQAPNMDVDAGLALFSLPGWRREKLQLLRWLAHDRHEARGPVLGALRRALADADWELRVTAMLAAARLEASKLAPSIAKLALPRMPAQGLSQDELRLLLALRDATMARLGQPRDRTLPPGVTEALGGDLSGLRPGFAACVHALIEPLPDDAPGPAAAAGIVLTDTGPELEGGRLLAWVPPLPHWLGDAACRHALPNPPRLHTPLSGFYIDAEPRALGSLAQARAAAQTEAQRVGRAVQLPTREAWEMAARGPDGRRFPWGMNAERQARSDLSPWGVVCTASDTGEWLEAGEGLHVGWPGASHLAPACQVTGSPDRRMRYRFAYL